MKKLKSLQQALQPVKDGMTIALGGNVLHRAPVGAALGLAQRKNLHIVKTAGAHDVDILCGMDAVAAVSAGFISYEPPYGQCNFYRKSVEQGRVKALEHACYSVMMALRASIYGIGFMPMRGFDGSDLIEARGFKKVEDPYSGEQLLAIEAIRPDYAIVHVQEADEYGNSRILGPDYEDPLMVRAAKKVIITTEKIVDSASFVASPKATLYPGEMVESVVHLPGGSLPGSCAGVYEINDQLMREFSQVDQQSKLLAWQTRLQAAMNKEGGL